MVGFKTSTYIMRCIVLFQDIWQEEGGAKCPSYLYSLYGIYFKHHQICALSAKKNMKEMSRSTYVCVCSEKILHKFKSNQNLFLKSLQKIKKLEVF